MADGLTWECTRCQARRYGQSKTLPSGWVWRLVYSTIQNQEPCPVRFDARCTKCVDREPPPKEQLVPRRALPW